MINLPCSDLRVVTFVGDKHEKLTETINEWFKKNPTYEVIEFQYALGPRGSYMTHDRQYTAAILYTS